MKILRNKNTVPEIWYKLQKEIEVLKKRYNVRTEDWTDDLWIDINENPRILKSWNVPNDLVQIGGIGMQGTLEIYYSPSEGCYYSECDSATPQKITLPNLWRQIILCLDNDIKYLEEDAGEGFNNFIKFQKEVKSLVQRLTVRY